MTVEDDLAARLEPRSPRRVLEQLAPMARALAAGGRLRPELELVLASGTVLRGRMVTIGEERDGAIVVIATGGSLREPTVAYVQVNQIIAVVVSDASVLVHGPSFEQPVPSKLELARQLTALANALETDLGRPLALAVAGELDDAGRRAVAIALPLVIDVLRAVAGDPLGKEALAGLNAIELSAAPPGRHGVERRERTLVVRAPTTLLDAFTAQSARTAIERVL